MKKKVLELNKDTGTKESTRLSGYRKKDIAIIGMSGSVAGTDTVEEFWNKLLAGKNMIRELSEEREKSNLGYIDWGVKQGLLKKDSKCFLGAYMEHIYDFDCDMFGISPREASLMEPNQRKFLEEAYHAIEDAGYGGEKLKGTNTGVFLGYSDDFFDNYKHNVAIQDPSSYGLSLVGSIRSILASRISYILDLKGPSMTFDTACSSSLIAIKEACQHLLNGECSVAIAGGVKIIQSPVKNDDWEINVQSPDNVARTFDNSASGTGGGEGAIAFVLKPLDKALKDGDQIHAVIKGWSNNQDGRTIGITAPSPKAQEELLLQLMEQSGVNPEDISFVEAHGTGTKLGDPIEVKALTKAFQKYTSKKAFCALSSLKTNIGHLDSASGAAGVLKSVLCLKHQMMVPHLHFCKLNRQIQLVDSPFYIPDIATPLRKQDKLHMGIVSSFGLSGTNCQLLLEEAPAREERTIDDKELRILTISAKSEESFTKYLKEHIAFVSKLDSRDLSDYCYTVNSGRGQYSHRCSLLFETKEELLEKLIDLANGEFESGLDGIYKGVIDKEENSLLKPKRVEIDSEMKKMISQKDDLKSISQLFVEGAFIDWDEYYSKNTYRKISAPVYPYHRICCTDLKFNDMFDIKFVTETPDSELYSLKIRSIQWVMDEHKVDGYRVLPGTSYIQIFINLFRKFYQTEISIKNLFFERTFSLEEGESRELQIAFHKSDNGITAMSKSNGKWIKHAGCNIEFTEKADADRAIDLSNMISQAESEYQFEGEDERKGFVSTGPRWNCVNKLYYGKDYTLVEMQLQNRFEDDLIRFPFHPAMVDCAANLGKGRYSQDEYLPFRYEKIQIFGDLTKKIYSLLELRTDLNKSKELLEFDVTITDEDGKILMQMYNYAIKKVNGAVIDQKKIKYYSMELKQLPVKETKEIVEENVLLISNHNTIGNQIKDELERRNVTCYWAAATSSIEDFCDILKNRNISKVIHTGAFGETEKVEKIEQLHMVQEESALSLFRLAKAIHQSKQKANLSVFVLGNKEEYPESTTAYGIARVINKEYLNVTCKTIDLDCQTDLAYIISEMYLDMQENIVYYKNGQRYIEELKEAELTDNYNKVVLQQNGAYLIPGGNGSIGLEMSKYLVLNGAKNIILLSRSNNIRQEEMSIYQELINLSTQYDARVDSYPCDITDYEQTKTVIDKVIAQYGKVNGVINCAGNAGDGVIINKDLETFEQVMNVKVYGSWILDKLLEQQKLDFVVLMSSITSVTAEIGQSDYTAANYYLNCLAENKRKEGKNYIAIDWPAWQESGMAARYHVDSSKSLFTAIKTKDAMQAFEEILGRSVTGFIPGILNLNNLKELMKQFQLDISDDLRRIMPREMAEERGYSENRKVLVKGKRDVDPIEQDVATIWGNVLQLKEIHVNDSFDKLGGDSIMAIRLLKELNNAFDGLVDMADIYTYSTVSSMAEYIRSKVQKEEEPEEPDKEKMLDDILDKLEKGLIDVDEVSKIMMEK